MKIYTEQDAERWIEANKDKLEKDWLECDDPSTVALRNSIPITSKRLWDLGEWIDHAILEKGGTLDDGAFVSTMFGASVQQFGTFALTAVQLVNHFEPSGNSG